LLTVIRLPCADDAASGAAPSVNDDMNTTADHTHGDVSFLCAIVTRIYSFDITAFPNINRIVEVNIMLFNIGCVLVVIPFKFKIYAKNSFRFSRQESAKKRNAFNLYIQIYIRLAGVKRRRAGEKPEPRGFPLHGLLLGRHK
jgi:hypothetical protein